MDIDIILIIFLIILGLPLLKYDFRLLIIIVIVYLLVFPEKRINLYNSLITQEQIPINKNNKNNSTDLNVLYQEGNNIIKELKAYKKPNSMVYQSIKITWKKFVKLSQSIMINKNNTYQHHLFSTLVDQRKYILNQMSSLIILQEAINLQENTFIKDRTLPLDTHIRILIRKMITVFDVILDIVKNQINTIWSENTYNELSPVEWNMPQPYNQNKLDPIM
jgi:hypothetical protein